MRDDDDVFREGQSTAADCHAEVGSSFHELIDHAGFDPNLPCRNNVGSGKIVIRAAPQRSETRLGDGRDALNQIRVPRPPWNDRPVPFPFTRILGPELLDLLSQLLNAFHRGKDRCTLLCGILIGNI